MVANGLLTNPTLFTGADRTTLHCVQQWINICFNSTLDENIYKKLSKEKTLVGTIPERPLNLTFQCFHHHLVFMLEKLLTRRKRQIFNNLQKFSDVLEFLENEFNIVPELFNVSDYFKMRSETIVYEGLDEVYHSLKKQFISEVFEEEEKCNLYDYSTTQGNFFENKLRKTVSFDYDLIDLFFEDR